MPSGEIVRAEPKELVICVKNEDYPVSLELRKLYPRELFIAIELPQPIRRRVLQAASPRGQHGRPPAGPPGGA